MTKFEQKVLAAATAFEGRFTPTAIGMAMGYEQVAASSRVAPALRTLLAAGKIDKQGAGHRVSYGLATPSD